jgi:beta-glucanase (GH16 family)
VLGGASVRTLRFFFFCLMSLPWGGAGIVQAHPHLCAAECEGIKARDAPEIPVKSSRSRARTVALIAMIVTLLALAAGCGASAPQGYAQPPASKPPASKPPAPKPPAPKIAADPGDWVLKFDDEFNGTQLDTANWSTGWLASGITGPVNSTEEECYDPAQVTESGGTLNLNLITKSESCGIADPVYASGIVNTAGKFSYTYGFVQTRVWLPAATGQPGEIADWPGVWTDGQNWPADGENDIVEGIGGQACSHFHSAVSPSGVGASRGAAKRPDLSGCASGDYAGWHTFGADWEPGSVTYYYDGKNVGSVTTGITSAPMFLIIDYAAGPPFQSPSTMKIDYVRVWQRPSS